jgi:hypothetical protein
MSFKAEICLAVGWVWNEGAVEKGRLSYAERLSSGNGPAQAEAVWYAKDQTLPDAESITLDLTDLTRTVFGDTVAVAFLTVKALLVVNLATSGGELLLGGAAADEWSEPFGADGDQIVVPLDSPMLLANRQAGWDVDETNRNLKLAAVGGEVTYSIAIVGTTTAGDSGSGS